MKAFTIFVITGFSILNSIGAWTNSVGMVFVQIPFTTVEKSKNLGLRTKDNAAVSPNRTDNFWIQTTEVTQKQWQSVMGTNPSYRKGDNRPVEMVSWTEAMKFCGKLSSLEGKEYCLPTEAEWSLACDAGESISNTNELKKYAWTLENTKGRTMPVGLRKPNRWGLYDMHGNVAEWCRDDPATNPKYADDERGCRILKGGSVFYLLKDTVATARIFYPSNSAGSMIGFRVVVESKK